MPNDMIGNKLVVRSGTIIGKGDEPITIYPIPADDSFSVLFEPAYSGDFQNQTMIFDDPSGKYNAIIRTYTDWSNDIISNPGVEFAIDEEYKYFFAYRFSAIGSRADHNIILDYCVLTEGLAS